ncbi:MAG: HdeD family acid-resistance protein [Oscillospiraceae bacterium]
MKSNRVALFIAPVLTIVIGIILIANSVETTVLICRIIGIILLMSGVFFTGSSLLNMNSMMRKISIVPGLIQLILGLFIMIRPDKIVGMITIIIGIIVLVQSFGILEHGLETKMLGYKLWWGTAALAVTMAILGIIIIVNPFGAVSAAMKFTGVVLVIQGVSDIITRYKADKVIEKMKDRGSNDYIDTDYTIK